MNRPRIVAALGGLLVALLLVAVPGPAAVAAPPDQPDPATASGQRATFGVRPSGANAPDTRTAFSYGATPGAIVSDYIAVQNVTDDPVSLRVYASDAFNTPEGGFDLLAGSRKPTDVGSWTALSRDNVSVPGRATAIVPFKLAVPANASPGDHVGGIVASLSTVQTDAKGNKVTVDQRVGTRIYLRVAGQLRPELRVEGLTAKYHPTLNPLGGGKATVTYRVRNTGNVRLGGHEALSVSTPWGQAVDAKGLRDLPELLPGNAFTVTAEVPDLFPAIRLTARVALDPVVPKGDLDPELHKVSQSRSFWAVSWPLIALVLLVVGAIGYLVWWLRRRRGGDGAGAPGRAEPTVSLSRQGRNAAALLVAVAAWVGVLAFGQSPAQAATVGSLTIFPGSSLDVASMKVFTSAGCPAQADAYYAKVRGHGFPADGQVVTANTDAGLSHAGGFYVYFAQTMKDFADDNRTDLEGQYDITVYCIDSFSQNSFGEFTGSMRFGSPTSYEAVGAAKPTSTTTPEAAQPVKPKPIFPEPGQTLGGGNVDAARQPAAKTSKDLFRNPYLWVGIGLVAAGGAHAYRRRVAKAPPSSGRKTGR